jgi:protein-L-isoaspartate(D-aspartate) O-methyltransferase
MNTEQSRFNMIEQQIRPWDVLDPQVLSLLALIKREDFVPIAHRSMAFFDTEIPLGQGQHMLSPKVEARMLQELAVQRHERVLEIGAGSGYMAALLSHQARQVISLELYPDLAEMARQNLQNAGITNANIMQADGSKINALGHFFSGPCDVMLLSGSLASVAPALLSQLTVGARLLAIVGQAPIMQATLFTCVAQGKYNSRVLFETTAPRLVGFDEPTRFTF